MSGNSDRGGSDQDRLIRIKLEVTIPADGTAPAVSISGPHSYSQSPEQIQQAQLGLKSISSCHAVCVVPGTVNRARVFAVGTAEPELPTGFPRFAHGVVAPGTAEFPGNGPPSDCKFVSVNPSNGTWCFENANLLEYADCSAGIHTVTVWYEYHLIAGPFAHYSKRVRNLNVDCTYLPQCSWGPPPASLAGVKAGLESLAYGYEIDVKGFTGPDVVDFNGQWRLRVTRNKSDEILHESEPSKAGASVALHLKAGAESRLEFRQAKQIVTYVAKAGAFRGNIENKFAWSESKGVGKKSSVPKSVVLSPV